MAILRNYLSALITGARASDPVPPRPARPVCVIGDLHGRRDLLDKMLARIEAQDNAGSARLVFAGDMIDRGPDAAGVLARLYALQLDRPDHVICLMGNHERMMLDFLDAPAHHGPRWMSFGGVETLASFGIDPWGVGTGRDADDRMAGLAQALRAALPDGMESWLRGLPLIWREGQLVVTHAGADPARRIEDQTADTLLWGHGAFARQARTDGIWVAHGHTVVDQARAANGRIAVDTGAWTTGRLSAAWITQGDLVFLTAQDDRQLSAC